jgi:chromosome segregation ATPase
VINKALRDALRPVMLLRQKRKADREELGSVTRKRFLEEEKRDKEQDEIENTINEGKVLQQKLDELKARVEEKTLAYNSTEKRVKALYEEQDAVQKRVDQSEAEETEMLVGHEWLKEAIKR